MLAKISRTQDEPVSFLSTCVSFFEHVMPLRTLALAGRVMGIFLVVAVSVVGGGVFSAAAYSDAVPGQMLYGAKLAVEKAQLWVAPTVMAKTKLYAEFADARIEEVSVLAETTTSSDAQFEEALVGYAVALGGVREGVVMLETRQNGDTTEVAKIVERKLLQHQSALRRARVLVPKVAVHIDVARGEAESVSLTTMAYLVEQHLAGKQTASKALVQQQFEERISHTEGDLQAAVELGGVSEVHARRAKAVIAEAKKLVKDSAYEAALSKIVEAAELAKEVVIESEEAAAIAAEEEKKEEKVVVEEIVEEEVKEEEGKSIVEKEVKEEVKVEEEVKTEAEVDVKEERSLETTVQVESMR
jgi:hypothetical protein